MKEKQMTPAQILQAMLCYKDGYSKPSKPMVVEKDEDDDTDDDDIIDLDALIKEVEDEIDQESNTDEERERKIPIDEYLEMFRNHSVMKEYKLSEDDVMIIAKLWERTIWRGRTTLEWKDALAWSTLDKDNPLECINCLTSLLDREVLSMECHDSNDYHLDPYLIFQGDFSIHVSFRFELMGKSVADSINSLLSSKWDDKEKINRDIFTAQKVLLNTFEELQECRQEHLRYNYRFVRKALQPIFDRIAKADKTLPFINWLHRSGLSDADTILAVWIYADYLSNDNTDTFYLINLVSSDFWERMDNIDYFHTGSKLLKADCELKKEHGFRNESTTLVFSDRLLAEFRIREINTTMRDEDDQSSNSMLFELNVNQSFSDLILPHEDKEILAAAIQRFKNKADTDLSQWGLTKPMTANEDIPVKGTTILLYGYPGTGKTFSAGAIASALDKKLYAINAAMLRNKYYGDSQKRVKMLFMEMRMLINASGNPPVFLLNEADQIIHARTQEEHSTSQVENAIQNIFLEELETFPGIIILTTNLVENIDAAYFRRFNIKIELHRPDYECRLKLWKLHLPQTIPGAKEIDLEYLAQAFHFTGGQISLVVQNACNEAITRKDKERRITLDDIIKYAILEEPWCRNEVQKRTIGFSSN